MSVKRKLHAALTNEVNGGSGPDNTECCTMHILNRRRRAEVRRNCEETDQLSEMLTFVLRIKQGRPSRTPLFAIKNSKERSTALIALQIFQNLINRKTGGF